MLAKTMHRPFFDCRLSCISAVASQRQQSVNTIDEVAQRRDQRRIHSFVFCYSRRGDVAAAVKQTAMTGTSLVLTGAIQ